MVSSIDDLIAESREKVAPYRRALDRGEWVSNIGGILDIERLSDALESEHAARQSAEKKYAELMERIFNLRAYGEKMLNTNGVSWCSIHANGGTWCSFHGQSILMVSDAIGSDDGQETLA